MVEPKTTDGILNSSRHLTHLILATTRPDPYLHFISEKVEAIKKFSNLPRATWLVSGSSLHGVGAGVGCGNKFFQKNYKLKKKKKIKDASRALVFMQQQDRKQKWPSWGEVRREKQPVAQKPMGQVSVVREVPGHPRHGAR